jgi:small subunit ribosomal protein S1
MVHLSDLDWSRSGEDAAKDYAKSDVVKVKVLDVDVEKERISLGIKQLTKDPFGQAAETLKKGAVVTGTVHHVLDNGIEVQVGDGLFGFIRKAELSRDRSEQRPDRFAVGEKVDARVISIDKKTRKVTLSIKQREIQEEKQAMAEYGSSDSGASLGDILGAAFSKAAKDKEPQEDASETGTEKKAKKKAEKKAEKKDDESADKTAEKKEKKAKTAKKKPAKATKKPPKELEESDAGDTPEAGDDTAE